jgi:hypothetical protein
MFRRILSAALIVLLVQVASAYPIIANGSKKASDQTGKVKAGIAKLGVGPEARVKVKLRDNIKLEGYIREAGAEHFTLIENKTGTLTSVEYSQVKQVKGNNLSKGSKIAIGIGAAVGVALLIAYAVFAANER